MDIKERLIDCILRHHGQTNEHLEEQLNVQFKEEEREAFKQIGISLQTRQSFYWRLYALTERVFIEQSDISDEEQLAAIVAQDWNESEDVPHLTSEVCRLFIQRSELKMSNKRKALESICRGDIESSKSFQGHSKFFTELLTRYVICHAKYKNELEVYELVDEMTAWFFPENQRETAKVTMRNLGFLRAKKVLGRLKAYKKYVGVERLVFQAGITEILIENKGNQILSINVADFMNQLVVVEEIEPFNEQNNQRLIVEPYSTTAEKYSLNFLKRLLSQSIGIITNLEEKQIHCVEEVKARTTAEVNLSNDTISLQSTLRIAEEEIVRLKQTLEQEKLKTEEAKEKTLVKLITALAGSKARYLMSDLFEESLGIKPNNPVISTGRLINLFSTLDLVIGLEPYTDGRELNQTFTIQRNELTKTFEVNAPIQSQEDEIAIKIIKYGWMLDNKVVVSPLVAEIITKKEIESI
ncbi:hypothetical protein [Paenibacillus amylolyticus]|uniref:hypothetical protein n=1 Tax=Paenibacillus amylolyticus TaxID=1451 RepID=UPI0039AF6AB0